MKLFFLLIKKYFKDYTEQFNININDILEQGVSGKLGDTDEFSMTIFSLKNAVFKNGVSQLHGRVSQKMWHNVWPEVKLDEVPIDYVTNGINLYSWLPYEMCILFSKYIDKDWKNKIDYPDIWKRVFNIPAQELWDVHLKLKKDLIDFTQKEIYNFYKGNHVDIKIINRIIDFLDHNHFIIGFARRFASYKRAVLIFNYIERINRILNDKNKPVHIIFSGKAHPADNSGCDLIKQIYDYSLKEEFLGKIIFLPNYNIHIARYMVRGTDVWLNNPRRPYEASGTSGQKAAVNGVINLSVLDGWWVEAYNKKNGWVIGSEKDYDDIKFQDKEDSNSLYDILENEVIPLYYNRSNEYPGEWVKMMKESITSNLSVFNTIRMVKEYCRKFYFPVMNRN